MGLYLGFIPVGVWVVVVRVLWFLVVGLFFGGGWVWCGLFGWLGGGCLLFMLFSLVVFCVGGGGGGGGGGC